MSAPPDGVRVRGGASAEEIAAVLAVVRHRTLPDRPDGPDGPDEDDPVRRWRRLRQAVTKPT